MDFSKIQEHLGDFGRFQGLVFAISSFAEVFVGIQMLANVFLLGIPKHRCYVPNCDNSSTGYDESFVRFSIPNDTENEPSSCVRYAVARGGGGGCDEGAFNVSRTTTCHGYVWDHGEFDATVVSDFNAVCDRKEESIASSSIYMVGVLVGAAVFGIIADRYGRRIGMILSTLLMLLSSTGAAFMQNIWLFTFLRFLTASAVVGLAQTTYIIAIEFIGTSKRVVYGILVQIWFTVGEICLGSIVYFVRDWRKLELVLSIPAVLLLFLNCYVLPESVTWLISKGRYGAAKRTIFRAARCNKVKIPSGLLNVSECDYDAEKEKRGKDAQSVGPLSLLKTPRLRKWSLNLFFNWMVNAMVFYGLSLSASHLSGSTYTNFLLLAVAEIPAFFLLMWALHYCGRRKVLSLLMVFGGVACGSTMLVPRSLAWVATIPAVIGKSAIAASFTLIYIYTCEIYPTILRSTGLGFCSMFARVGGIAAPVISGLTTIYEPFPMIIFAITSVAAGLLALALPETHGRQLPETIDEVESFGKKKEEIVEEERTLLTSDD